MHILPIPWVQYSFYWYQIEYCCLSRVPYFWIQEDRNVRGVGKVGVSNVVLLKLWILHIHVCQILLPNILATEVWRDVKLHTWLTRPGLLSKQEFVPSEEHHTFSDVLNVQLSWILYSTFLSFKGPTQKHFLQLLD